jgi:hypothetical protein
LFSKKQRLYTHTHTQYNRTKSNAGPDLSARVPEHVAPSPGAGTRLMVETDYMPRHTYWTNYNYPSRGKTTGPGSIWGGGYMDTHTFYNDDMYLSEQHIYMSSTSSFALPNQAPDFIQH